MSSTLYAPPETIAFTRVATPDTSHLDRWAMRFAQTPLDYPLCSSALCAMAAARTESETAR